MSDIGNIIKILIEKVDFNTFLFSILVSILFHKLIFNDWWWFIAILCSCYLTCIFVIWVFRCVREEYSNSQMEKVQGVAYGYIYDILSQTTKQDLIDLYRLPPHKHTNARSLCNYSSHQNILNTCKQLSHQHQELIKVLDGTEMSIIIIDNLFCKVLEEHLSDFE